MRSTAAVVPLPLLGRHSRRSSIAWQYAPMVCSVGGWARIARSAGQSCAILDRFSSAPRDRPRTEISAAIAASNSCSAAV